jgi:transposase
METQNTTPLTEENSPATDGKLVRATRRGRPSKGESIALRKQIIILGKNTKNLPMREIADQVGVSINTVSDVLAKYGINKLDLDTFVDSRNAIVKSKQQVALDALTPEKASKASFKDLAIAYGVLLDKDRLESGESTSNVASWSMIVQKAHSKEVDITPPVSD